MKDPNEMRVLKFDNFSFKGVSENINCNKVNTRIEGTHVDKEVVKTRRSLIGFFPVKFPGSI